jgi:hypothetical protein
MWLNSFVTAADPVSPDDLLFVLLVAVPITLWLLSRVRLGSSPDVGSAEGRDFPLAVQRQIVERSGARRVYSQGCAAADLVEGWSSTITFHMHRAVQQRTRTGDICAAHTTERSPRRCRLTSRPTSRPTEYSLKFPRRCTSELGWFDRPRDRAARAR